MRKPTLFFPLYITLTTLQAQKSYLHCGLLIDVENDRVIDLSDKTALPGLMDMHVRIEDETGPKRYEEKFRLNDTEIAFFDLA